MNPYAGGTTDAADPYINLQLAEAFRKNLEILYFFQFITVNVSAEANL